eukprot:180105-Chlamydomonas_euryale.AAC.1
MGGGVSVAGMMVPAARCTASSLFAACTCSCRPGGCAAADQVNVQLPSRCTASLLQSRTGTGRGDKCAGEEEVACAAHGRWHRRSG